ncbi:hypothetical protein BH23CHL5_BH23CHL5_21440 [soil metagenome]
MPFRHMTQIGRWVLRTDGAFRYGMIAITVALQCAVNCGHELPVFVTWIVRTTREGNPDEKANWS